MDSALQAKIQEFFQRATPEIQGLLVGDEVNKAAAVLGKLYSLPVSKYVPLKNIITFLLLGITEPKDAVSEIEKDLGVDEETATKIAKDMDKTILQKARVALMGEDVGEVKVLKVGKDEEANKEELRKVILDTTKRESALEKSPVKEGERRQKKIIVKGSHSELVEQLNLLGSIPDDDEIKSRLENIRSQIKTVVEEEEKPMPVPKELENMLSGGGKKVVAPQARPATYSVAPTSYNIDPYREVPA